METATLEHRVSSPLQKMPSLTLLAFKEEKKNKKQKKLFSSAIFILPKVAGLVEACALQD